MKHDLNLRRTYFHAVVAVALVLSPGCAADDPLARTLPELRSTARRYGILIISSSPDFPVENSHGKIEGKAADLHDARTYANLFQAEFSLYPESLVRRSMLKQVVFCDDLKFAGQRRTAIPDFEHDMLYLDVRRGAENPTYLRKVLHHEFFHIIDYRDDGAVYEDPAWKALNFADFAYGRGGASVQDDSNAAVLTDAVRGFLNSYSTTGVEEDKAELFANLMVDFELVLQRAESDPILQLKIDRVQQLLSQFCPEMDEQFWARIRAFQR